MKSGLAIRADNAESVLESLRQLSGMDVLVGIPEDKAGREDGSPINNAELGYLHSTGATVEIDGTTVTLPPVLFWIWGSRIQNPEPLHTSRQRQPPRWRGRLKQQCVSWRAPDRLLVTLQKPLSVLATDCTLFLRKPSNADVLRAFPATSRCMPTVTCCAQLTTS